MSDTLRTASTRTTATWRSARPVCSAPSTWRACSRRPTSTSPRPSAALGRRARRAGAARRRAGRPRGASRLGLPSTWPRCPPRSPTSTCRGPTPARGRRRSRPARSWRRAWCTGSTACSTSTATTSRRPRSSTTCDGRGPRRRTTVDPELLARVARRGSSRDTDYDEQRDGLPPRRQPVDDRDHRRAGHRQDHRRRRSPGRAARAGARPAARRCASRWPHPTGKAAARLAAGRPRLGRALRRGRPRHGWPSVTAMTLHRLLRQHPGNSTRFRHHRGNRLPHDLVVVDETSMVSLTMMARLLEAVRPDARLVLVGDPDQLSSVDAGAVLTDLVRGFEDRPDSPVAALTHDPPLRRGDRRAGRGAPRCGDADAAIEALRAGARRRRVGRPTATRPAPSAPRCCPHALAVRDAAAAGDADRARWRRSTGTGCCARTATAPSACATGTGASSSGSPRRPATSVHDPAYLGRPVLVIVQRLLARHLQRRHRRGRGRARRAARRDRDRRRSPRARAVAARRRRDDARDDHPQVARAARPTRSPCCCPTRSRGC